MRRTLPYSLTFLLNWVKWLRILKVLRHWIPFIHIIWIFVLTVSLWTIIMIWRSVLSLVRYKISCSEVILMLRLWWRSWVAIYLMVILLRSPSSLILKAIVLVLFKLVHISRLLEIEEILVVFIHILVVVIFSLIVIIRNKWRGKLWIMIVSTASNWIMTWIKLGFCLNSLSLV